MNELLSVTEQVHIADTVRRLAIGIVGMVVTISMEYWTISFIHTLTQ